MILGLKFHHPAVFGRIQERGDFDERRLGTEGFSLASATRGDRARLYNWPMQKRTQKPLIRLVKVDGGYEMRFGPSHLGSFQTKSEALKAAVELERSSEGTLRKISGPSKARRTPRFIIDVKKSQKGLQSPIGGGKLSSKQPLRSTSNEKTNLLAEAKLAAIETYKASVQEAEATARARADAIAEGIVVHYMTQKDVGRRWKTAATTIGVVAGITGVVASVMTVFGSGLGSNTPTEDGLTIAATVITVAALLAAILILKPIRLDLWRSQTTTNTWAAKIAEAVWDEEMASSAGAKRLNVEGNQ